MNKVKFLLYGFIIGASYAFISFFLITGSMREFPLGIVYWGIEGFLFALFFLLIQIPFQRYRKSLAFCGLNGIISSLLISGWAAAFTYYNAIYSKEKAGVLVISELKRSILLQLGYYLFGCLLLGLIMGIIIWSKERDYNQTANSDAA
jgi:hypothetical protein